ncbi:MAG: methyltransferase domain-containing protein [Phycisphaera sp.]|nr:methyltransferase domain-containing protein [Phycisphaera sp.]
MTDTAPHTAPGATREFFTAWKLYQDVIDHNYMVHRQIVEQLRAWTRRHGRDGMSILDLGCGDAYTVRSAMLDTLHHVRYTGVDLAAPALHFADRAFADSDWTIDLREGDLAQAVNVLDTRFDLVVAGHALHHLDNPAKQRTLTRIRKLLTDTGHAFLYDLITRDNEPRDAYLQRLLADADANWTHLSADQLAAIRQHVENYDFPVDLTTWRHHATDAGFADPDLLFRDELEHYAVLLLTPR